MLEFVPIDEPFTLGDYEGISRLTSAVRDLRSEAGQTIPRIGARTTYMVNSTAQGGGVAEMLPKMVALLEELGLPTRWAVISTERTEFFGLTKRLHNLIHGEGDPNLSSADRELYETVSRENAAELRPHLSPDDLLVIHDPQPLGMAPILKQQLGLKIIWRCHIGLDEHQPATRAAWSFLRPYAEAVDQSVFTAPEYIPDYLAGRATIIRPALDPQSHKNRELSPHKLVGILCNSGLKRETHPVVTPPFSEFVRRLAPDGTFGPAANGRDIGALYRPVVSQISRWDRLKGFLPLLEAFARLKRRVDDGRDYDERHLRRLQIARLLLVGPDPASVSDDPEGLGVLKQLCDAYCELPSKLQDDVVLLVLPMGSRKENALMVNALQRCSTVVVQNSLREGFGLTATEAMWKGVAVLGTHACGLRQQIRDGIDGRLTVNPADPEEIADHLDGMLADVKQRDVLGRTAERRVHQEFLVFAQLGNWLRLFERSVNGVKS